MSEAEAHNLASTFLEPDNEENGLYVMAGFHILHCLAIIRASLQHYKADENQTAPWPHVVHCVDQLRQTLMCDVDTTLLYVVDGGKKFADGQVHVCKDYWRLHHWLDEHAPLDTEQIDIE
ncbi:MAG: hypothetical protein M1827_003243 [Pycnora praestabilis]|nr:MAG: hypothetical protein M1827_003243 [Pycnora praestabilis]